LQFKNKRIQIQKNKQIEIMHSDEIASEILRIYKFRSI